MLAIFAHGRFSLAKFSITSYSHSKVEDYTVCSQCISTVSNCSVFEFHNRHQNGGQITKKLCYCFNEDEIFTNPCCPTANVPFFATITIFNILVAIFGVFVCGCNYMIIIARIKLKFSRNVPTEYLIVNVSV